MATTTFTITERGGWWFPTVTQAGSALLPLSPHVGIIEAAQAVTDLWPDARLVGIR